MLISISFFYYCIATFIIIAFKIFGTIEYSDISFYTVIINLICFLMGCFFLKQKINSNKIVANKKKRFYIFSIIISSCIIFFLLIIIKKYGNSPMIYKINGLDVPTEILNGRYRDEMPLKSFFSPLVLINMFMDYIMFEKKNNLSYISFITGIVSFLLFIFIYETRYILIWLILYIIFYKCPNIKDIRNIKKSYKILFLFAALTLFFIFVIVGNARSGVTQKDNIVFALAMSINSKYSNLPIAFIWILIYMFSNLANGIVNSNYIPMIDSNIPKAFFPGFIQNSLYGNYYNYIKLYNYRFLRQAFGIDGFHRIALNYGWIGAICIFTFLFSLMLYLIKKINTTLKLKHRIPGYIYAIYLFITIRIVLLPIADYIDDFSAFLELIYFVVFLKISDAHIENK